MPTKRILFFVLFATLWGCAEPRYEVVAPTDSSGGSQGLSVSQCKTRLQNSGHCLLWDWEKRPTSSQAGSLVIKIVRANALDDSPVPVDLQGTPSLLLWMPSMGHGSTPTRTEQIDTGSFRISEVFFVMPGEWEMRFQLTSEGTVHDEAVISLLF